MAGMARVTKVTFTLDDETVGRLRRIALRLARPQSQVVREAIRDYDVRSGKLTDEERQRLLDAFDRLAPAIRARTAPEIQAEIAEVRAARRASSLKRARRAGA
jgi:predicted transcriptional regulator